MNTTIIILGAAILIVIIVIVVVLIKGKDTKEETPETNVGNTFKDESNTQNIPQEIPEPQPQMTTPQLHQQDSSTTPIQNAPVLNDLNTPINSQMGVPPMNSSNTNPSIQDINQPNPLPDDTQMQSDMANLTDSTNQPYTTPNIPDSVVNQTQTDDIDNIANTINTQVEETQINTPLDTQSAGNIDNSIPTPATEATSVGVTEPVMPTVDNYATSPLQEEVSISSQQPTPMEEATAPINIDTPAPTVADPNTMSQQNLPTDTPNTSIPQVTPPPITPM